MAQTFGFIGRSGHFSDFADKNLNYCKIRSFKYGLKIEELFWGEKVYTFDNFSHDSDNILNNSDIYERL
uniref:Uncharacterized protein n=1 Tax=Romanomermis culicivorax TaxID=13658 RepID=A0A915HRU9_ROMCU